MNDFPQLAFIGAGNMAGALIEGMLANDWPPNRITVVDIHEGTRERWASRGLNVLAQPSQALSECPVWVLAVKPQQLHEVSQSLKPFMSENTLIISIAAGISLQSLGQWFGSAETPWPDIIRAMPNTPAFVGRGMTGLAAAQTVDEAGRALARRIMESVGDVVMVDGDAGIDSVTAISGSGPAYVFRFIEALIEGGTQLGLSPEQARALAIATLDGAAALARESTEPVSVLRENVTSPGGTTAAALNKLQSGRFLETIVDAVHACHARAGELSQEFGRTD